jgi:arylesterase / paraoxonase
MNRTVKRASIALGVLAGAIAVFGFDYLLHAGAFSTLKPATAGPCTVVPLDAPAEDIRIDLTRGIAYLSTFDRRAAAQAPDLRGTVLLLDLNVDEPRPRAALASIPQRFRPRGMSLYAPATGPRRLFVVNERGAGDFAVEIFEETPTGAFAPLETIADPLLVQPESIAAIGPRAFYVANESGATSAFGAFTERLLRRELSTVLYFDGEKMRIATQGVKRATGIAVSNHGLSVFVSEGLGKRLLVFDRDSATGMLEPRNFIELEGAPDNITLDADGTVWLAAHPKLLALRAHLDDRETLSPTLVYRLRRSVIEKEDRLSIPYLNLGEELTAGSVAAVHGDHLLIGSLTERKVLHCRLPEHL